MHGTPVAKMQLTHLDKTFLTVIISLTSIQVRFFLEMSLLLTEEEGDLWFLQDLESTMAEQGHGWGAPELQTDFCVHSAMSGVGYSLDSPETQASGLLPRLLSEHHQQKPCCPTCVNTCLSVQVLLLCPGPHGHKTPSFTSP